MYPYFVRGIACLLLCLITAHVSARGIGAAVRGSGVRPSGRGAGASVRGFRGGATLTPRGSRAGEVVSRTVTLGRGIAEIAEVAVGRASMIPPLITRMPGRNATFVVRSPQTNLVRAYVRTQASRGIITDLKGNRIGTVEATGNVFSFYDLRGARTGYAILDEAGGLRFYDLESGIAKQAGAEVVKELSTLVQEIQESAAPPMVAGMPPAPDDEEEEEPVETTLNQRYPDLPSVDWRFVNGDSKGLVREKEVAVLERDRGPKDLNSLTTWLTDSSSWEVDNRYTNDAPQRVQINRDGTGAVISNGAVENFTWEPVIVLKNAPNYHYLAARLVIKAADGKMGYGYITYQSDRYAEFHRPPIDRSLPSWHPVVQARIANEIRSGVTSEEPHLRPAPPQPPKKGFFSRLFGR